MLETRLRTGLRLTAGVHSAIALLSLPTPAVLARLAVVAADNPALRVIPPPGAGYRHAMLEPEGLAAPGDSLIAHVLHQIDTMALPPRARAIALVLAEGLEPTGWLGRDPAHVARDCNVPLDEVMAVLHRLHAMEPGGLFARTLAECLTLQAQASGQLTANVQSVLDRLPMLAAGDLAALAQSAAMDTGAVQQAVGVIRGFDPKPGLVFTGSMPPPLPPDLLAKRDADGWRVMLHPSSFRVEVATGTGDRRAALHVKRAIARRDEIGLQIATLLVTHQAAHLNGTAPLRPISPGQIAEACGVHIATVNRVLRGVSMETPRGTGPLRRLQARALGTGGAAIPQVRARLAELLAYPGFQTLPDLLLARMLRDEGMPIARRTVAKYRVEITGQARAKRP